MHSKEGHMRKLKNICARLAWLALVFYERLEFGE